VKGLVRPAILRATRPLDERYSCPICGYRGPFKSKRMSGLPGAARDGAKVVRRQSKCPRCGSVERHRLQSLVLDEWLPGFEAGTKAMLHIAPEPCLQPRLREAFGTYHTMDLFRDDVDFNEDVQAMSFGDASYDAVFVSRVLSIPPDFGKSLREIRRVLRPGGVAIISEYLDRETTEPDDDPETEAARFFGVDVVEDYERVFDRVETRSCDEFDGEHQLINLLVRDGKPVDDVPRLVRAPGLGVKEVLFLCYAGEASSS
jgi:SAM-dependent methyltransferase/ribosomal protein S27AE